MRIFAHCNPYNEKRWQKKEQSMYAPIVDMNHLNGLENVRHVVLGIHTLKKLYAKKLSADDCLPTAEMNVQDL